MTAVERYKALTHKPAEANSYRICLAANKTSRPYAHEKALLLEAATLLQTLAGIQIDLPFCGITELEKFQKVLPQYCIRVFNADSAPELIFRGPSSERDIFLILDEYKKHYSVISGPLAFFGLQYYCLHCDKSYTKRFEHSC